MNTFLLLLIAFLDPSVPQPFIKQSEDGTFYAKGIPESGRRHPSTKIFRVGENRDVGLKKFDWFDPNLILGGSSANPILARLNYEITKATPILRFYSDIGEVSIPSDAFQSGANLGTRLLAQIHGFRSTGFQNVVFEFDTADHYHVSVDPRTGQFQSRVDMLRPYLESSAFEESRRWASQQSNSVILLGRFERTYSKLARSVLQPVVIFPERYGIRPGEMQLLDIPKYLLQPPFTNLGPLTELRLVRADLLWRVIQVQDVSEFLIECAHSTNEKIR